MNLIWLFFYKSHRTYRTYNFISAIRRIELVQVHCTCRYPSAELGRTKCEILHIKCSTVSGNCPIPAAVPPLQGRAPEEREPPEEMYLSCGQPSVADSFLSCGQPSVAAGPRQVQRTCTLRKILFAYANSNFPPFGIESS